jgi:RNA polymerase sigma-70 factor (ECF subfamily)
MDATTQAGLHADGKKPFLALESLEFPDPSWPEQNMITSEDTLVARAVNGDADALGELLYQHGPAVEQKLRVGRAWRAVLDPADVMQITYLEAFLGIERFDPARSGAFPSWLQRIAENNLRDAIRGLERQKRPPAEQRAELPGDGDSVIGLCIMLGVTTTTPSRVAARGDMQRALEAAIASLPPDYATVIRRYDLESCSITQVATELGRSPGAVHMLRARAHDRLRDLLGSNSTLQQPGA